MRGGKPVTSTAEHPHPAVFLRKLKSNDRADAFFALNPDLAAVLAKDALNDHQTEAVTTWFSRVIGLKDSHEIFLFDSATRVTEKQIHAAVVGARANSQDSARLHRFHRVFDQIKKDLLQLIAVGHDDRKIRGRLGLHCDSPIFEFALL